MTKTPIHFMSDLHLEHSNFDLHAKIESGILVLAGDVSVDFTLMDAFFRKISENVRVVYVLGNHEYEGKLFDDVASDIKDMLSIYPNVKVLDNETTFIDGIKIIGSTLWTNFDIDDHFKRNDTIKLANDIMPDFNSVRIKDGETIKRFTAYDAIKKFEQSYAFIETELNTEYDGPVMVVTHFTPSRLSTHPKFGNQHLNAYWSNKMDHLVELADIWIHGHTHESMDYSIGDCKVFCNPRGNSALMNLSSNAMFEAGKHYEMQKKRMDATPK